LPTRDLMVVLERPLVPEAEYVIQVGGILNLAGVPGGGGSMSFRAPTAAPPPAEEPAEEADRETVQPVDEQTGVEIGPGPGDPDPAADPDPKVVPLPVERDGGAR